jgi:hypothetical protein
MAERLIVVDREMLKFEGMFEAKAVVEVMQAWALDKGYWLIEKRHGEATKPEGKYIDMEFEPFKKLTDYAKSVIKIRAQFNEVKDIVVERDGKKTKLQEGKIIIAIDGILETDYEHRWESKPGFYVMRTLFEKYVYTPFISGFERGIREDTMSVKNNLKAFLNLTKYA